MYTMYHIDININQVWYLSEKFLFKKKKKENGNLTLRKLKKHIKQRANVESFKEYFSFVFFFSLMLYYYCDFCAIFIWCYKT